MSVDYVTCVQASARQLSWSQVITTLFRPPCVARLRFLAQYKHSARTCVQCVETDPCLAVAEPRLALYDTTCKQLDLPDNILSELDSNAAQPISCLAWQPFQPAFAIGFVQGMRLS